MLIYERQLWSHATTASHCLLMGAILFLYTHSMEVAYGSTG